MRPLSLAMAAAALLAAAGVGLGACAPDSPAPDTAGDTTTSMPRDAATARSAQVAEVAGPDGVAVGVPAPVAERWNDLGGAAGTLGPAVGPASEVDGGSVADFSGGTLVLTPAGRVFVVQGGILEAYRAAGGPAGDLGFPIADETTTDGGWISAFEGGTIALLGGEPVVELR